MWLLLMHFEVLSVGSDFFDDDILSFIYLLMLALLPDRKLCTCSSADHIIIFHTPFSFES